MNYKNIEPGFYLLKTKCYYVTGVTKGNKVIDLTLSVPSWVAVKYSVIDEVELMNGRYSKINPSGYPIK